jgi:hypothetical protein
MLCASAEAVGVMLIMKTPPLPPPRGQQRDTRILFSKMSLWGLQHRGEGTRGAEQLPVAMRQLDAPVAL